jgi:hypothetical protein
MHNRFVRVATAGLIVVLLFSLNAWLFPSTMFAQEDTPELPVGDFRLLIKEEFILEQIETQLAPFTESLSAYGLTLSDPSIDFRDNNRIDVSATTELPLGNNTITVRPTVTVAITAANNQMSIAIEGVTLEGMALPGALLGPQLESFQEQAQTQINEALVAVERLGGLELAYIGTTEDLLILDFNFNLQFYELDQDEEPADN